MKKFITFKDVSKIYTAGEQVIKAVDKINFEIEKGELVVIVGPSGAGKTTVLNMLGGMDSCSEGEIYLDSKKISSLNERQLTKYRRYDVGFVFQFYNLIQNMTALENVELACAICNDTMNPKEVLCQMGLENRLYNFPSQLSGGEQQRVSIARALAKKPKIILCDEPTGALDYDTGKRVLGLLQETCRKNGQTVIIITHNTALCDMADRVIKVKNGKVSDMILNENPLPIKDIEW